MRSSRFAASIFAASATLASQAHSASAAMVFDVTTNGKIPAEIATVPGTVALLLVTDHSVPGAGVNTVTLSNFRTNGRGTATVSKTSGVTDVNTGGLTVINGSAIFADNSPGDPGRAEVDFTRTAAARIDLGNTIQFRITFSGPQLEGLIPTHYYSGFSLAIIQDNAVKLENPEGLGASLDMYWDSAGFHTSADPVFTITPVVVPETATLATLAAGALLLKRRRR